ncbi:MAG TPA: PqqD family peptide modification chaperone [Polyangiaceae bacterium]
MHDIRIPITNHRVRRRRYEGKVWLILENYYTELDEATDAVWTAADGERTVAQVGQILHEKCGLPIEHAVPAARATLEAFAEQGLLSLTTS